MKTIQIPLELAEEILEELLPDSYHKLKKLVDEQTAGTMEAHENGDIYRVWRFPFRTEEEQKEHDRIKEDFQ